MKPVVGYFLLTVLAVVSAVFMFKVDSFFGTVMSLLAVLCLSIFYSCVKSTGYGSFLEAWDLPENEIFSVVGKPVSLGDLDGYVVIVRSRTGARKACRFKDSPPPGVFQVKKLGGKAYFVPYPPISTSHSSD